MHEIIPTDSIIETRLEKLFYQVLDFHDKQVKDSQLLIKEKEALGNLTQLLINQTKEFGQYEAGIRKRIQDCIKASADAEVKKIADVVVRKMTHILENSSVNISEIAKSMEATLANFRVKKNNLH